MSLGATLENQPGVASRSFGPAPARPVIRGLDGDRVLILQDGQRLGDVSSQSGDHGVAINPAAAQRIEVVRGPATLLYGANAIGGLVNVITDEIPTRPMTGASGNFTFDAGSAATEAAGAGDVHVGNGKFALHVGGGGRPSGDVDTPEGTVPNSQSRSGVRQRRRVVDRDERLPRRQLRLRRHEVRHTRSSRAAQIQLTPRRHAMTLRGGAQGLTGAIDSFRATLALRRYKHDELDGDVVGTAVHERHQRGRAHGIASCGRPAERERRRLVPRSGVRRRGRGGAVARRWISAGFAAFLYEEVTWPHVTFQFGGRIDHTRYSPLGRGRAQFHHRVGLSRGCSCGRPRPTTS